ncbi:MAG TPA: hypothetical protein VHZ07_07015 [Bryobacteraceae bacterium]|nr:hypothetical protein [Bryobacteraceae bacterium]
MNRPTYSAHRTFTTCVNRVRDPVLKTRLEAVADFVEQASKQYEAAALASSLHTIAAADLVGGDITRDEMKRVYTDRMAKKGAPGRYIYDEIFAAPAQGRCPLCGHRAVTTLDHHLPKAHFPALGVAPLNLVPACNDCNKAKLDAIPREAADVSLHPYFDVIDNIRWLRAEVIETCPAALRFCVEPPTRWSALLQLRVARHFQRLGLGELYASESAEELLNIQHQLVEVLATDGAMTVRTELGSRATSAAQARLNGWRTAAYEAWSASDWFCNGGFRTKV